MTELGDIAIDLGVIFILLAGISLFRSPVGARRGNVLSAVAVGLAAIMVVSRNDLHQGAIIIAVLLVGAGAGWWVAARVTMVQIPAMVAFQHGAGGVAAFLVSFVELSRYQTAQLDVAKASGILGLVLGAATFSASLVASAKLIGLLSSRPLVLPAHGLVSLLLVTFVIALAAAIGFRVPGQSVWAAVVLIALAAGLGWIIAVRIGGADMPVLISFLNATAGIAAAFCGVIIQNRLLVACGATVAASGSILTHVMCKGMNRSLLNVFLGFETRAVVGWMNGIDVGTHDGEAVDVTDAKAPEKVSPARDTQEQPEPQPSQARNPVDDAVVAAQTASRVVIVPGYGMALAQAQFKVVELAELLEQQGKNVEFAIHPVAGRMPGHMNVLLAEADASYDKLLEMDQVNPHLKDTDLAIIVGACDVVNPAAERADDTPIRGMPILKVQEAKRVVVCNLDDKPGYSGVDNPLYDMPGVIPLFGDAKETISRLIAGLSH